MFLKITPSYHTHLSRVLKASISLYHISFLPSQTHIILGSSTPINLHIPNISKTDILSLKRKRIIFLDQISSVDGSYLLPYKEIKLNALGSFKGRVPNWFKKLKESAIFNNYNRRLCSPCTSPTVSYIRHKTPRLSSDTYYRPKNEWSAIWDPQFNCTIYGKTIEQINYLNDNSITYRQHYIPFSLTTEASLTFRKTTPILIPC